MGCRHFQAPTVSSSGLRGSRRSRALAPISIRTRVPRSSMAALILSPHATGRRASCSRLFPRTSAGSAWSPSAPRTGGWSSSPRDRTAPEGSKSRNAQDSHTSREGSQRCVVAIRQAQGVREPPPTSASPPPPGSLAGVPSRVDARFARVRYQCWLAASVFRTDGRSRGHQKPLASCGGHSRPHASRGSSTERPIRCARGGASSAPHHLDTRFPRSSTRSMTRMTTP